MNRLTGCLFIAVVYVLDYWDRFLCTRSISLATVLDNRNYSKEVGNHIVTFQIDGVGEGELISPDNHLKLCRPGQRLRVEYCVGRYTKQPIIYAVLGHRE